MKRTQAGRIICYLITATLIVLTLFMGACSPARTTLTGIVPRTTATTDADNLRGKVGFNCHSTGVPGSNIDGHYRTILGDGDL
jgi:hypothetical protein